MVQLGGQPVGKPALQGQLEDWADVRRVLIDLFRSIRPISMQIQVFNTNVGIFQKLGNCRNVDGPPATAATGVTGSMQNTHSD